MVRRCFQAPSGDIATAWPYRPIQLSVTNGAKAWPKRIVHHCRREYRPNGNIPNKVGAFLAAVLLNRILTALQHDLHFRQIMDDGRVLLINLAKGRIGENSASLLGGLLVTTIGLAGYSRTDIEPAKRRDFVV